MLNHAVLMGRLTAAPELRRTGSGIAVASFTLAVERDFAGPDGMRETDFIDCVAWKSLAEFLSKHFTKGQMAAVAGRLQVRGWVDKSGMKRRTVELIAEHIYFAGGKRPDAAPEAGRPLASGLSAAEALDAYTERMMAGTPVDVSADGGPF